MYTGTLIVRAIGSGKTSACMYPYVGRLLAYRAGPTRKAAGLVLEVKGDFCRQVRDIQASTNLVKFVILLHQTLDDYVTLFQVYECVINPDKLRTRIAVGERHFGADNRRVVLDKRKHLFTGVLKGWVWRDDETSTHVDRMVRGCHGSPQRGRHSLASRTPDGVRAAGRQDGPVRGRQAVARRKLDRIIVGEVRAGEAFDLLQALNTGPSGPLSTIHANSAEQALERFLSCVVQSGVELPYQAVRYQIADAFDLVLHLGRSQGARVVQQLLRITSYDVQRDRYAVADLFQRPSAIERDKSSSTDESYGTTAPPK